MQQEVIEIVKKVFHKDADSEITAYTSSENLPEWDSFGQITLIQELEKVYQTKFTFDEIIEMESVAGICEVLENRKDNE